jgi:transporter family protein
MNYIHYSLIALIGWGLWGFGVKLSTRYLPAYANVFFTSAVSLVILAGIVSINRGFVWNRYVWLTVPVAVLGTIALVAFYRALETGPASVVIPLTGIYIVLPAILGFVFLQEKMTWTKVTGIILAILAIIFLSR